jgi:mono/diheme cytochrome c family protein
MTSTGYRAMRRVSIAFLSVWVGIALIGCSGPYPSDVAATAGPPAIPTPVGPIPGPWPGGKSPTPQVMNPLANNPEAVVEGRQLFVRYNCSGCHGGHAGGGMGPSLRDRDWLYGSSDADIFDSIAEGRANGMPAWGVRLPSDQIWQLVAYIKTLRTDREVDPPAPAPPSAPADAAALIP